MAEKNARNDELDVRGSHTGADSPIPGILCVPQNTIYTRYFYKIPLRDVVDLKSRTCRKLKRGSKSLPLYPTVVLLCDRTRFDDVCWVLRKYYCSISW